LHKLSSTAVSVDSSVVVDFHLSNSIAVLTELFVGRVLLSDFVDQELAAASISLPGAEIVAISSEEDWNFLDEIRRKRPGLGLGELGAITVARSRGATLLARQIGQADRRRMADSCRRCDRYSRVRCRTGAALRQRGR
jgi:hypothetical protein